MRSYRDGLLLVCLRFLAWLTWWCRSHGARRCRRRGHSGALLLLVKFERGRGGVEPQGKDPVEVAGAVIQRGDVSIDGEVAGTEIDGLVRCSEEYVCDAAKGGLARGLRAE